MSLRVIFEARKNSIEKQVIFEARKNSIEKQVIFELRKIVSRNSYLKFEIKT